MWDQGLRSTVQVEERGPWKEMARHSRPLGLLGANETQFHMSICNFWVLNSSRIYKHCFILLDLCVMAAAPRISVCAFPTH